MNICETSCNISKNESLLNFTSNFKENDTLKKNRFNYFLKKLYSLRAENCGCFSCALK